MTLFCLASSVVLFCFLSENCFLVHVAANLASAGQNWGLCMARPSFPAKYFQTETCSLLPRFHCTLSSISLAKHVACNTFPFLDCH